MRRDRGEVFGVGDPKENVRVSSEHIVSVARAVFGVPKGRAKGVTSAHTTVTMVRLALIRI